MYATAEDVRVFSRLSHEDLGYGTEAEFEAHINELIIHAEGIIESYCHVPRHFFEAGGYTETRVFDYRDDWIHLRYHPVLDVTKVEVNTAPFGSPADWKTLASTDYLVAKERGLLKIVGDTKPAERLESVRVTYTAGYSETPKIINYVIVSLVSNMLHEMLQRKISPVVRIDDFTVRLIMPSAFTSDLQRALAPFVHHQVFVG